MHGHGHQGMPLHLLIRAPGPARLHPSAKLWAFRGQDSGKKLLLSRYMPYTSHRRHGMPLYLLICWRRADAPGLCPCIMVCHWPRQ